jgi:hypothetical protein
MVPHLREKLEPLFFRENLQKSNGFSMFYDHQIVFLQIFPQTNQERQEIRRPILGPYTHCGALWLAKLAYNKAN